MDKADAEVYVADEFLSLCGRLILNDGISWRTIAGSMIVAGATFAVRMAEEKGEDMNAVALQFVHNASRAWKEAARQSAARAEKRGA